MLEETIVVDDVKVQELVSKRTNKPYKSITLTGNNTQYRGFLKDPVNPGDTVQIQFEQTPGKNEGMFYNNVQAYKVVDTNPLENIDTKTVDDVKTFAKKTTAITTQKATISTKEVDWAAKDLSMELSGLLQAIIQARPDADANELARLLDEVVAVKRAAEVKHKRK